MAQDAQLHGGGGGNGVDAERVGEVAAEPVELVERLGLPSGAVEGVGEQGSDVLVERVRGGECAEVTEQRAGRAEVELGLEPPDGEVEMALVEPAPFRFGEREGAQVGEGGATPVPERGGGRRDDLLVPAAPAVDHDPGSERTSRGEIDDSGTVQLVTAVADQQPAVLAEVRPGARYQHAKARPVVRGGVGPEVVDEVLVEDGVSLRECEPDDERVPGSGSA